MTVASHKGLLSSGPRRSQMPYGPPFTTSELLTIEAAICEAWSRLSATGMFGELSEVGLTKNLLDQLDLLMNDEAEPVPGFSADVFETPVRGGELRDYRGIALEKRPDIVFRRVGRNPGVQKQFWALFVECKVMDPTRTAANYCLSGLLRFVDGRYAWAVPVSMMLAYSAQPYRLPTTLEKHFKRKGTQHYGQHANKLIRREGSQTWASVHDRTWLYTDSSSSPGPITVLHLWLPLP